MNLSFNASQYFSMSRTRYPVCLTQKEVELLQSIGSKTAKRPRVVLKAKSILLMDEGEFTQHHWTVKHTAEFIGVSPRTLNGLRKEFAAKGIEAVLEPRRKPLNKKKAKFDSEFENKLTEIASEEPPDGHKRWTLRLLANKVVELKIVDAVSHMTVQRALKKKATQTAFKRLRGN